MDENENRNDFREIKRVTSLLCNFYEAMPFISDEARPLAIEYIVKEQEALVARLSDLTEKFKETLDFNKKI